MGWEETRLLQWDYLEEDLAKTWRWPFGIPHPLEPPTELHKNFLVILQLTEKSLHHAVEALGHAALGAWQSYQPRVQDRLRMLGVRRSKLVGKEVGLQRAYAEVGGR